MLMMVMAVRVSLTEKPSILSSCGVQLATRKPAGTVVTNRKMSSMVRPMYLRVNIPVSTSMTEIFGCTVLAASVRSMSLPVR